MNLRYFILSITLFWLEGCKRARHSHGRTTVFVNVDLCEADEIRLLTEEGDVRTESPQSCERRTTDQCELESRLLPSRIEIDVPDNASQIGRCRSAVRAERDGEMLPVELRLDYASTTIRTPRFLGGSTTTRRLYYYLGTSP